jgi:LysM repeat protein
MTIMSKNAQAYGLDQVVPDAAIEYDTIVTTSPTNLALISDLSDAPVSELVQLNPALLRNLAPGNFEIRVPKGTAAQVNAGMDLVPTELRAASRVHRVEAGESVASIARIYNSTAAQISTANSLHGSDPAEGDRLVVPAAWHEVTPAVRKPRAPARASAAKSSHTVVASRRAPVKKAAAVTAVAAKRPVHRAAGNIAQVQGHAPLNR